MPSVASTPRFCSVRTRAILTAPPGPKNKSGRKFHENVEKLKQEVPEKFQAPQPEFG